MTPSVNEAAGDYWSVCKSVRAGKQGPAEFRPGPADDSSWASVRIGKLSNRLSAVDWADVAYDRLTSRVHQRHVLTLWDTNMMVLVSTFGSCVTNLLR